MPRFDRLNDAQLNALPDEEILTYINAARAAGDADAATTGLQVLVYGYMDNIRMWVGRKVPRQDVDDLAHVAMLSAITSTLDGRSIGEFRSWLSTIVKRKVADYWRKGRLEEEPLFAEGDEHAPTIVGVEDDMSSMDLGAAIEEAMEGLSDVHRRVVEIAILEDQPARVAVDTVNAEFDGRLDTPMAENNVYKIASRYRTRLRGILADAERDDGGAGDGGTDDARHDDGDTSAEAP